MTTASNPKKRPASKASASKKEAEKTNSKQEKAVKALRVAKDQVEKAATDVKKTVKAVKKQIDTEENRTKVKAAARLSKMKAVKAKDKAETLLQKTKAKAEEVMGQMEKAAKGHPKAEAALKQAKQAKAKVESAGEKLKEVKDTMAKQGAKAQKATKKAVGKTKSALDKAVKTAQKFKDTVDTPANRAKVKDAAYSIGSSLKEAVGDVIKEVSKARTASKAKTGKSKVQTEKTAPKATKSAKAKTGTARTATKSAAAKPAAGKKKVAAEKSADKPAASQSAKGGRADEDVTEFTAKELGLSTEEYGQIGQLLGHIPSFTELSLYARMWSEEVSYKNSIKWLRTLPWGADSLPVGIPRCLASLGDGRFCALEVHSGFWTDGKKTWDDSLRQDLAVMARGGETVAKAGFLRLGNPSVEKNPDMKEKQEKSGLYMAAVVAPVYGETSILDLVSMGVVDGIPAEKEAISPADEVCLIEIPVPRPTDSEEELRFIQEAVSALLQEKAVLALQAIGRSGLAGGILHICGAAGKGVRLDFSRCPSLLRDKESWELLMSSRLGCFVAVIRNGQGDALQEIFRKYSVNAWTVGEILAEDRLQCFEQGRLLADVPASSLVVGKGSPVYDRKYKEARNFAQCKRFDIHTVKDIDLEEAVEVARFLSRHVAPSMKCTKAGDNGCLLLMCGNDAYVYANPMAGAQIAIAEAARVLACSGARPLCVAPCLNFGPPQNPEAYWQFVGAVKGMGAACEGLRLPVIGADVSFAKLQGGASKTEVACPTFLVSMPGVQEGESRVSGAFTRKGHAIYLLGKSVEDINGSRYLLEYRKQTYSPAPYFNLEEEYKLQRVVLDAIDSHLVESVRSVSRGGLFMALIESAKVNNLGFDIMVDDSFRLDSYLFGESQGRVIVTIDAAVDTEFKDLMMETKTPMVCLGEVTDGEILVDDCDFGTIEDYKRR